MEIHVETTSRFGQLIRDARVAQGWSQADLAQKIGSGRRFIVDLENGKATAHVGLVMKAVSALGMKMLIDLGEGVPA
ncbi:transcriptional regulator [Caulobacter phage Sansa]|uniref:Transcriptional regulator n=1 Tax=Caulobacter phage Sansa TaxID=1675600 RepID=A0A0K1LLP9_9CAUD|nr:transcriptional regulator [Caulobacter phage Sansa]AKU43416.1 transcriptional regulator [Caulobacter phage Sansa]